MILSFFGSFFDVSWQLFVRPQQVLTLMGAKQLSAQYAIVYSLAYLLFFALAVGFIMTGFKLAPVETMLTRFGFGFVLGGVIICPLMWFVFTLLQRFGAWFFNVPVGFFTMFQVSGLSIVYVTAFLWLSIVLAPLQLWIPLPYLYFNFLMLLTTIWLCFRLFQQAYVLWAQAGFFKAWWMSLSPIAICLTLAVLNQLLAYFTSFHVKH